MVNTAVGGGLNLGWGIEYTVHTVCTMYIDHYTIHTSFVDGHGTAGFYLCLYVCAYHWGLYVYYHSMFQFCTLQIFVPQMFGRMKIFWWNIGSGCRRESRTVRSFERTWSETKKKLINYMYTVRIGQYAFENKDDNIHKKRSVKKTESPKKFCDVQWS